MASSEKPNKNTSEKAKTPNKDPNKKNWLNYLFLGLIVLILTATLVGFEQTSTEDEPKAFSDLIEEISDNNVSKITLSSDKSTIEAELYKDDNDKDRGNVEKEIYKNIGVENGTSIIENIQNSLGEGKEFTLGSGENEIQYEEDSKPWYVALFESWIFQNFIFLLLVVAGLVYLIRKIGQANNKTISFGNSRARSYDELDKKDKVTFKDVAGNEEAKTELREVIDFLKRPEEYIKMGAKIPRGVLLVGYPGNGKTLMAKAVAGEAEVPFFLVSGSEFVEMFVGVGAGRVRNLFQKAVKKSPCVIFIDEIDAVGRQRGTGLGGGNDEREQTLNQILVEMDGFEDTSSVIVIAATNRPDVLDPALLRPGRFTRQITVTAPDREERKKILEIHSKNKKISKQVDYDIIAKRTPGFSAADLMNVMNEAAILTVREKKKEIDNEILREAIEKVMLGPSLKSKVVTEKQKKLTAYHEAGHALMQTVLAKARKVQKITIIPRGRAAGYTFGTDNDDRADSLTRSKSEFLADIIVSFGGYVVEETVFGEVSTGASNDLLQATNAARDMVTKYGMSELGPISYDEDSGPAYLGKDMVQTKHFSEDSAKLIDDQVRKILNNAHTKAKEIVRKYRKNLDKIANTLVEKEVIEHEEFNDIVKGIIDKEK